MNGEPTVPDADQAGSDEAETGDAEPGDKAAEAGAARGSRRSGWRELPVLLVVALVVALIIKTFVVQAFYIPSGSMENTLLIGDKILVNKLVYDVRGIEPGDIVVFNGEGSWDPTAPQGRPSGNPVTRAYDATLRPLFHSIAGLFGTPIGQTDYVKRVIGVPGDHVACCTAQGLVTVNGVPLHERSYLYPGNAPSGIHFHITVPPGRIWVMGDHRAISDDSRLHRVQPRRRHHPGEQGDRAGVRHRVAGQPVALSADPRHVRPARHRPGGVRRRTGGAARGGQPGRGHDRPGALVPAAGRRPGLRRPADLAPAAGPAPTAGTAPARPRLRPRARRAATRRRPATR